MDITNAPPYVSGLVSLSVCLFWGGFLRQSLAVSSLTFNSWTSCSATQVLGLDVQVTVPGYCEFSSASSWCAWACSLYTENRSYITDKHTPVPFIVLRWQAQSRYREIGPRTYRRSAQGLWRQLAWSSARCTSLRTWVRFPSTHLTMKVW